MKTTKFKNSEIGPIPEEWEVKRLGDVCSNFNYGVGAEAVPYISGRKYIRITDIDESSRRFSPPTLTAPSFETENSRVNDGDILVARTGASVGKTYVYDPQDGNLTFAGFLMRLHPDAVNHRYVFLTTLTGRYAKWVDSESARSGQPGINIQQLKTFQIPVPPRAEQEKIAAALSDVDELLAAMTALIEKKRAIKQGAMQELLEVRPTALTQRTQSTQRDAKGFSHGERGEQGEGFKTGLTGFTGLRDDSRGEVDQTSNSSLRPFANSAFSASAPTGENPVNPVNPVEKTYAPRRRLAGFTGAWVERRLGEVADFMTATVSIKMIDPEWYIGTENMLADKMGVVRNNANVPYQNVRSYQAGDILTSNIRPYLKKIWLSDRYGGCSTDVLVIRSKDREACVPQFLKMVLSNDAFFDFAMANAVGTKMPRGDKKVLVNYEFYMPAAEEQKAIAGVLADMDAEIAALEAKRSKYEQIKQGMMQELLTGRVRLG